jgi:hypothetical protein
MTLRRSLAFALVPLSAVPLALGAPLVAPSVEERVKELRGQSTEQQVPRSDSTDRRRLDPPASSGGGGR